MLLSLSEAAFAPYQRVGLVSQKLGHISTPSQSLSPTFSAAQRRRNLSRKTASAVTPLQALPNPLIALASSPLASLIILASIVLVHESGHYLAARMFGIEVEEFSIGVGPKLVGFKAFGDEFNLRALPLGGYVRFPENYNATEARVKERAALRAMEEFDRNQEKDLGYTMVNTLTLGALDDRRRKEAKKQREQARQELTKLNWLQKLTQKKKQTDLPEIIDIEDVQIDYYDDPNLLQNRPWQQRAIVLSAGVIFNILLSFSIYFGQIGFGAGLPQPIFDSGAMISAEPRRETPAYGVLHKGDVVISANGVPITVSQSPSALEAQKGINNFISSIRETPDGESIRLTIVHAGDSKTIDIDVQPKRANNDGATAGPQTIGVLLTPNFVKSGVIKSDNIVEAASMAANYAGTMTTETAKGLTSLFVGLLTGQAGKSAGQVSGPIGLIRTGTEVVATQDWATILAFASAISINLGVVNAFPLPALDGGQLLFVLSEAVTGRKVDQRLQEGITGAALLFLLLASAGAAFNDIESIFAM